MKSYLHDKRVFVTGACGTVGQELCQQLLEDYHVDELIGIDNNESALFFLEQRFTDFSNAHFYLADIRDANKLIKKMKEMQVVFHTAAFKHVILCERSPFEAVQTNIIGIENIINAACANDVEKVIFTSSDKAVNPTNVMGTSKLMGERLMTAANSNQRGKGKVFASTRFGNVLGSRGSVIPIFREQIRKGGPITLTDPNMTRFIMSIKEAVRLVADSVSIACGGEVFITKMPVIRIIDLAEVMIQELSNVYGHRQENIDIDIVGVKPGEKMYEELMNKEETRRAIELPSYFSVLPAFKCVYNNIDYSYKEIVSNKVSKPYHSGSEAPLSKSELKKFLYDNQLLYSELNDLRCIDLEN